MKSTRVFVTGLSALTSTGTTLDATWEALIAGRHALGAIENWDISSWPYNLGGELKDFKPASLLPDRKLMKVISRQDAMGIIAALQAVNHSDLLSFRETLSEEEIARFNDESAVYVGSPGNKYFQQYDFLPLLAKSKDNMKLFAEQLFETVHPMWLLRILPNNVLAYTGITCGFKGPNHNVTNHAVSGTQALLEAYHAIKSGQAERAVVVAYDSGTEPQALFYYDKLGVLSRNHLKPFDESRDGTILAEGAAAIVLESEASAKARNATCYSEIVGGGSATEASGLFSLEAEGQKLSELMQTSMKASQLTPSDFSFIVAHGNGNAVSDDSEARAIQSVFGDTKVPVTAFKWSMGHTLCTSGILDTVLASFAMNQKCLPGIAPLTKPASAARALSISSSHQKLEAPKAAMIINRGFASMNACVVIKACE